MANKRIRYRPGHAGYVSEFTQFLDRYIEKHPDVVEDQRRGWYIYWDHAVDLKQLEEAEKDSVPTPPYYYP
ncbi:MAG TPA: DUF3460 domain-containing protein [Janthinobacterium sp.]|nr:DUF3460 domain-containing protein [Janthinobacterium sp.]